MSMRARGILPTNRPDDIPLEVWSTTLYGQSETMRRAIGQLQVLLVMRPLRALAAKLREAKG